MRQPKIAKPGLNSKKIFFWNSWTPENEKCDCKEANTLFADFWYRGMSRPVSWSNSVSRDFTWCPVHFSYRNLLNCTCNSMTVILLHSRASHAISQPSNAHVFVVCAFLLQTSLTQVQHLQSIRRLVEGWSCISPVLDDCPAWTICTSKGPTIDSADPQ